MAVRTTRTRRASTRTLPPSSLAEFDHAPREERRLAGKELRKAVPRTSQATWEVGAVKRDPVALLVRSSRGRIPELVPVRYGRMLADRFSFYRGSPAVMAHDLSHTPSTGLAVQACGDAHLSNFGAFASSERNLVFDLNDFDETIPGPWEWDLKRLVASCVIATRNRGWADDIGRQAAAAATSGYRAFLDELSHMAYIDAWYHRFDLERLVSEVGDARARKRSDRFIAKARTRDSMQALSKLCEQVDGEWRIIDDPPLIEHTKRATTMAARSVFDTYLDTTPPSVQLVLRRYRLVDVARKVVGVGSVGTRCFVLLMAGSEGDPLFLQVKQANASVLEPFVGRSAHPNHGQRVVEGQRITQAAGDPLLGWTHRGNVHFYVRQLRDWKLSFDVSAARPEGLVQYASGCGRVLAQAHARSGDAAKISGYLGTADTFDRAMADFAVAYADQNDADYEAFTEAVGSGRIQAITGL